MFSQPVTTGSGYSPEQLKKVAQDFESLFSSMMLRAMRKTVGENPLIPMGMGEKIYTEMLDDEYAKMLSTRSSLGLSDLVFKELMRSQNDQYSLDQLKNLGTRDFPMIDRSFTPTANPLKNDFYSGISRTKKWDSIISQKAEKYGVDKDLVCAVIAQESGGNPYAISRAGAKGLMQLMDQTASELGISHPFNPSENIEGGVKYLREMLDQFGGDEKLALASYNAGPAAVKKYKGIPPYPETVGYVDSVLRLKQRFSQKD
ncbi:MAG TPA: transglycosylase SLT domain-containing protein [Chitinispirillaceae bacterium]|nr:transglycosylase SLT domain-containing protein [Chitinispirillaceae bacterium]